MRTRYSSTHLWKYSWTSSWTGWCAVGLAACALACGEPAEAPSTQTSGGEQARAVASTPPETEASAEVEATTPVEVDPEELRARGRGAYVSNCIACHNPDPAKPGGIGPEIAGASAELLRAKVIRNEYPSGYTAKRDTRAMIPLPHLEGEIEAPAAFLDGSG